MRKQPDNRGNRMPQRVRDVREATRTGERFAVPRCLWCHECLRPGWVDGQPAWVCGCKGGGVPKGGE